MDDETWEYIRYGRQLVTEESYSKAFDIFVLAFERDTSLVPVLEAEFRTLLLKLNNILAECSKMDVVFKNFGKALRIYPNNTELLNDIGIYLYKYGCYREAWEHFEYVLNMNPSYVNPEKNLNSIKNVLVERWHFRMLNDNFRNECYRQAIRLAVHSHEVKVLDVGTGTGLLAIYAHEAGARKVIGCDGSDVMSSLADNIVHANKIKNIKVINKMSTDLNLWDTGGKCSLLLMEMFDAGLFGEHVLQMLSHAWPALLSNKAKIVPYSAEFFVEGAHSEQLVKSYQLCSEAKEMLNIPFLNVHIATHDETYDCEDVHLIQDIKYITEPQSVVKVNFNDLANIRENLERAEPYKVQLRAKETGIINTVIGWFNLYLSETITITTDPKACNRANAWQQAIFFDNLPKNLIENETVHLEFLMNGGKLTMVRSCDSDVIRVSPEMIRFLNDTEYMKMITGCLSMACVHLEQIVEMSQVTLADLCPFPVFGLLMVKRGARSLVCCARNEFDKEFIVHVCKVNQIPMANITIVYGDDWTIEIFGEEDYHAIFTHAFELSGDVDLRMMEIGVNLRHRHLVQGGLFMPARVSLVGQLGSSHWLDLNNRLYDDNVSKYKMETHVNIYTVTQNFCIDFSVLKYVPITDPEVLCPYPNGGRHEEVQVTIKTDGYANAILCWYNIELMDDLKEISTNRPKSFIDGMLFLTYSKQHLVAGKYAKIIQYKDTDGGFKLVMEYL